MKNKHLFIAMLFIAVAAMGCKKSEQSEEYPAATNNSSSLSVTQQLQNVKQDATNAWQKTKETTTNAWANVKESLASASDYTYDKKNEFVTKAQADLDAIDQKLKELSDQATNATANAKDVEQTKIEELKVKQSELNQKLGDVKNATAEQWSNVKTGFKDSYDGMTNSLAQAWQWLKDKVQ